MEDETKFWEKEIKTDARQDRQNENEVTADLTEQAGSNIEAVVVTDETGKSEIDSFPQVENAVQPEEQIKEISEISKLIQEAIEMETQHLKADQEELENYRSDAKFWANRLTNFTSDLETSIDDCKSKWGTLSKEIHEILAKLSDPNYVSLITGRLNGIDLVVTKMMGRLLERCKSMLPERNPELPLVTMSATEWDGLALNKQDQALIIKEIAQRHKKLSNDRYKVITDERNLADKNHKTFISFVEKQVLPIIDGIVDGEKNSQSLKKVLPSGEENIICFGMLMSIYHLVYNSFIQTLNKAGVYEIVVKRGEPINYERHEPFDMEPDGELSNEQIKETLRNGYEYEYKTGQTNIVLRATQVVVVKN